MPEQQEDVGESEIETDVVEGGQITGEQTQDFKPSHQNEANGTTNGCNSGMSARKLAANRRNATKSTGPKSSQGKRNSSRNAIKHGILSKDVVVAKGDGAEDAVEFEALRQQLWEKYDPQDIQDELDVEELATAYWRKCRALRAEMGSIRLPLDTIRADRSRERLGNFERQALLLNLDGNKEHLLATPESIEHLLRLIGELEMEIQNQGYVLSNSSRFEVLEYFGVQLTGGVRKGQLLERLTSLKADLTARRRAAVQVDSMHLEAQIAAAALPSTEVTTKVVRYMTAIDRRIEQIRNRLEKSAELRRN